MGKQGMRAIVKKPRVTGIAGGIGSGKSVVSRILRLQGHSVYDCDIEARRLMEDTGGTLRPLLADRFGADIFTAEGYLDRRRLAALMFSDPETLAWVNSAVHSAVRADIAEWVASSTEERVWIESAILASSGLTAACDDVWMVTAPEEVRLERAIGRGMSAEDARRRIEAQREEESLLRRSGVPVAEVANGPDDTLLDRIEQLCR